MSKEYAKENIYRSYGIILMVMLISRLTAYGAGLDFDLSIIKECNYQHLIDLEILKRDFWKSLYFMQFQPPAFTVLIGFIAKIFDSAHYADVYRFIFFLIGASLYMSMFSLMRKLNVSNAISLFITIAFLLSSSALFYENYLFHDFPAAMLIVLAIYFYNLAVTDKRSIHLFLFFLTVSVLILTRSTFHFAWFLFSALFVLAFTREYKKIFLISLIPFLLILGWYGKNLHLIGKFSSHAWGISRSMATMVTYRIPVEDRFKLYKEGKVSRLVTAYKFPGFMTVTQLRPVLPDIPAMGHSIIDNEKTKSGCLNFNHIAYRIIAKPLLDDAVAVIKERPEIYARAVYRNLNSYLSPATKFFEVYKRRRNFKNYDKFSNIILYGQLSDYYRYVQLKHYRGSLTLYLIFGTSLFVIITSILAIIYTLRHFAGLIRYRKEFKIDKMIRSLTVIYMGAHVFYIAALSILAVECMDTMRFRFIIDPLLWIFAGLFLQRLFNTVCMAYRFLR